MTKKSVFAMLAGACALLFAPAAQAMTYRAEYDASVLAVSIGRVTLEAASANGRYSSTATVRTAGVAAIFDQTNITASASGLVTQRGVAWSGYNLSHSYARKFRRVTMRRAGGGVQTTINPRFGDMGNPPVTAAEQAGAYDPVSAIFVLGRIVGQTRACAANVRVFDGRQHYRLALSARGTGTYDGGGYRGPALICNMRYQPISGFDMSPAERARIPLAQIWFSRPNGPGFGVPLRVTVPTPVGAAQLDLRALRFTP
ncbi:MAG: DUF3108 domain-containing protein [Hyphomonadaceae bacterium]